MKPQHWAPVEGGFEFGDGFVRFRGASVKYGDEPGAAIGTAICDINFGGGRISADVEFTAKSDRSACDLTNSLSQPYDARLSKRRPCHRGPLRHSPLRHALDCSFSRGQRREP